MKKIILETTRVSLRSISNEDVHLLQELDSDSEVMKYLTGGRPSTEDELQSTMVRILNLNDKHEYKFGVWLAYERNPNEFMGWFLFRPSKKNPEDVQNIELGYRLKKKFWGKGMATEVSKALVTLGFGEYKLDSIFATALKENQGSQAVMKKAGLKWVRDYIEEEFPGKDKLAARYEMKNTLNK